MSFKLTIGRVGFAATDLFPNEAIVWIDPHDPENILPEYLAYYLSSLDYARFTGRAVKGQTLNVGSLRAIPIQLPSVAVQRRVVELVGSLDTLAEAQDRNLRATRKLLSELRAHYFDTAGGERLLGETLSAIVGGSSPRCFDRQPAADEWGVLKLSAIQPDGFVPGEAKALPEDLEHDARHEVRIGDILITRANTSERVGFAAEVREESGKRLLSDLMWRLEPAPEKYVPAFLAHMLASPQGRRRIQAIASGTNHSMQKINRAKLRAIAMPVPDLEFQAEAVDVIGGVQSVLTRSGTARVRLRTLRDAVLRAVLSGGHSIPSEFDHFVRASNAHAALEGATAV